MRATARPLLEVSHQGFMFIELLIVMGVFGIIATIAIVAINPAKHFCQTNNTKRHFAAREYTNAVNQYEIKTKQRIGGSNVPVGEVNAQPICAAGVTTDITCINADALVPDFLIQLPHDVVEVNPNFSGYSMYRLTGGLDFVIPMHLETCSQ